MDAAVNDIDRAADCTGAEQQGGRTLEHLDLVGQEWIDGDRMVGAVGGGIHRAQPFRQHLDPAAFQTADDRTTHRRAEEAGLDTGQPGHGFAKGGRAQVIQASPGHDLDRAGQAVRIVAQRRCGHHHLLKPVLVLGGIAGCRRIRRRPRGIGCCSGNGGVVTGGGHDRAQAQAQAERYRSADEV